VGHYAADAVLCFAFDVRTSIVDTNTIRVAGRFFDVRIEAKNHRSKLASQTVRDLFPPSSPPTKAENWALLDVAAKICRPDVPECDTCPLNFECATGKANASRGFFQEGQIESI
jgi:A/G-specific adenine glycosylase